MKKVLVIDFEDSFVYNIIEILRCEGVEFSVVSAREVCVPMPCDFSGVVLSPGGYLPDDFPNVIEFIDYYHSRVALLGICLGCQAISRYFGYGLFQIPRPLHGHSAELSITSPDDIIFKGIPQNCSVGLYHSWAVEPNTASPLEVIATDSRNIAMVVKHKSLPIYGLQFHPESIISGENGKQMLRNWFTLL